VAEVTKLRSLDGTLLAANVYEPAGPPVGAALLSHGILSEKTESGLYDQLGDKLARSGILALALDFRGHGESEGDQTAFAIAGILNDLRAGADYLTSRVRGVPLTLIAASFSGGVSIYASQELFNVDFLVLLNPRINYRPWIEESTLFEGGQPSRDGQESLKEKGYCERRGFRIGIPLANELATWTCSSSLRGLDIPTLILHGTADSVIPLTEIRDAFANIRKAEFVEVPDAQHGFTDAATDNVESEETGRIRGSVIDKVVAWIDGI
jgi:alpha-beta hydrolase superfamily lysophospholipase